MPPTRQLESQPIGYHETWVFILVCRMILMMYVKVPDPFNDVTDAYGLAHLSMNNPSEMFFALRD